MATACVRCPDDDRFHAGFEAIRNQLDVPSDFSPAAHEEVTRTLADGPSTEAWTPVHDRRDVDLVTIDPPGSRDLDQAFGAETRSEGYRVHYAIADVAAFVRPGGALEAETLERGVTLYAPDHNTPLHPRELSEGAASLLPNEERQALLWTIDLDASGALVAARLERALVRSRELLTYRQAQDRIDAGHHDDLQLLREIGRRRQQLERDRGAVSLNLPAQELESTPTGYQLVYDESIPVEGWNAQISLLTGIAAAGIMLDGDIGLLRTLPEPDDRTISQLRRTSAALDIDWPADRSYPDHVRDLDPADPDEAALLAQSARALRGAGYVSFAGERPTYDQHSAIASHYAHVTAPLRRVCDRYANEVVLALCHDHEPPAWATEQLEELPSVMGRARSQDRAFERMIVDFAEALTLESRVGETFHAVVTDDSRDKPRIQIRQPAVVANLDGSADLGDQIMVRLVEANPEARTVTFERT